jgi:hypothetical protein
VAPGKLREKRRSATPHKKKYITKFGLKPGVFRDL